MVNLKSIECLNALVIKFIVVFGFLGLLKKRRSNGSENTRMKRIEEDVNEIFLWLGSFILIKNLHFYEIGTLYF